MERDSVLPLPVRSRGVEPRDVEGIEDLDRLPLVSRADLQAADPNDLRAASANRANLIEVQTSGSTGEPLTVYLSQADLRARAAVEQRVSRLP